MPPITLLLAVCKAGKYQLTPTSACVRALVIAAALACRSASRNIQARTAAALLEFALLLAREDR